jgi:hypothetical protein
VIRCQVDRRAWQFSRMLVDFGYLSAEAADGALVRASAKGTGTTARARRELASALLQAEADGLPMPLEDWRAFFA